MLLFNNKAGLLGLDIGSSAIKLVAFGQSRENQRVVYFASAPLPPGAVVDKVLIEIEAVAAVIAQTLKKSGCSIKHAAVAAPATVAISRLLTVPADLDAAELEAHVELETERCIPYPLHEICYDFEVLGKNPDNAAQQDVLLVAARTEAVEDRMAVVELAGLKPSIVDVENYAIENTVELLLRQHPKNQAYRTIAFADIGVATINFQVIADGKTLYSREEPLSAAHNDTVTEKSAATLIWLVQQLKRSLQFFQTSGHAQVIELLILAGGRALCEGLARVTANELGLATLLCNPFSTMSYASKLDYKTLQYLAPTLATACGLALRAFDK